MPAALDNFPCRKIKLLEPKAANCKSTDIINLQTWNLIKEKKTYSSEKSSTACSIGHIKEMECSGVSWGTCETFKYDPTTKLLNAENSPGDIAVPTAGTWKMTWLTQGNMLPDFFQ